MLIFALALAAQPPAQLTDIQQRDIACVGVMALIANDQEREAEGYNNYPDVRQTGKKWAGIVGERVMEQTGLPKEVVGIAMTEAAKVEQNRVASADEPMSVAMNRFLECQPLMEADVARPITVIETEAFYGVNWGTDDPAKLLAMRRQLMDDLADAHRVRFCRTQLDIARREIVGREGSDSRDAKMMTRLVEGLTNHAATFPLPPPGSAKPVTADELIKQLEKDPSQEEQMGRCMRMGQAMASRYKIAE